MSCVYEISFKDCVDNYIGSCIDLHKRKYYHKSDCYNEKSHNYNYKLYQFIRDKNYDWENVIFEVLEQHDEILDNLELRKREQHFIDDLHPTLNSHKAYQTAEQLKEYKKEHYEENREYYKEKYKKYREENKTKINKKCDCECGGKYTQSNNSKHIKTKKHQDYLDNLEKNII